MIYWSFVQGALLTSLIGRTDSMYSKEPANYMVPTHVFTTSFARQTKTGL